jgi:translocation and assembly module TamA
MNRMQISLIKPGIFCLLFALLASGSCIADELQIVVQGVSGPMLENVRNRVEPFRITGNIRLSRRGLENIRQNSIGQARSALRPFGHYHASVVATIRSDGAESWILNLEIDPGPPVIVSGVQLDVQGDGAGLPELQRWKTAWPLPVGAVLNQPSWDEQKQAALDIAESRGYLLAHFVRQEMAVDLEKNQAELDLMLETGEQAVMGTVTFNQDLVNPGIMEHLPRFRPGDPYNAWIQEKFRIDIWQTGYFGRIEVLEDRQLEETPPRVDLTVNLRPRKRNTYQGAIGIGSDTGPRLQATWNRHLVSRRGDSFMLGTGWQQHNNEYFLRGNYRIPRKSRPKQFWIAEALYKRETEDVKVTASDVGEDLIKLGAADINDYSLRMGRLKIHDRKSGFERLFETLYAQLVRESVNYRLNLDDPEVLTPLVDEGRIDDTLERNHSSLAFGVDLSLPVIQGNGWEMTGHNHRAWLFTAKEAWGSDSDFSQAYFSTRWNLARGERWKFLLRGEVGYSDALVKEFDIEVEDQLIHLSVTDLPNLYRFKAGGSTSVRGYGFERLSNNGIGSNHIVTASAELEMLIRPNWSVAAFVDVGNAFNEWDDVDLKKGFGAGIRWYTIAGAVRVDFAKALDLPDEPWRIHFTIGTNLL